jgi:Ni,Fe-hydrogenase maturation factor
MISTDCNYQLNIEDSADIANYEAVIFVDASVHEDVSDFKLEKITPDNSSIEFTMHAVSPSYILDLCNKIYSRQPQAYVLHIRAYEFDFIEALTPNAEKNINAAFLFLKDFLFKNIV